MVNLALGAENLFISANTFAPLTVIYTSLCLCLSGSLECVHRLMLPTEAWLFEEPLNLVIYLLFITVILQTKRKQGYYIIMTHQDISPTFLFESTFPVDFWNPALETKSKDFSEEVQCELARHAVITDRVLKHSITYQSQQSTKVLQPVLHLAGLLIQLTQLDRLSCWCCEITLCL